MSNETTNSNSVPQAHSIRESISRKVKESNKSVVDGVIDSLVNGELERRKEMIKQGVEKYEALEKELRKMKPDNVSYNLDGSEQSSSWSKEGLDKYNKSKKELETLNTAIESAIVSINYEPLLKLLSK